MIGVTRAQINKTEQESERIVPMKAFLAGVKKK